MELKQFLEKTVIVGFVDGQILRGYISDYVEKEHNENGMESLIIEAFGYSNPIEFNADEIKSIEIIKH